MVGNLSEESHGSVVRVVRVGTRGSALATTQTGHVIEALQACFPSYRFERVIIKTTGDARQNVPFSNVGVKGMFVKEIEEALLAGEIDFAVHSMKDMPGELPEGLTLASVPQRADPRDALLSDGRSLDALPRGARVGTSSLRRAVQVLHLRPDLKIEELRGNLDTRIRKLDEGQYDAIVVASAGLERMDRASRIVERLDPGKHIPAPGQGALALEARDNDGETRTMLSALNDPDTADAIAAERAFQAKLGLGCGVPIGAHATVSGSELTMRAMIAEPDGSEYREVNHIGARTEAAEIGREVARRLMAATGAQAGG